MKRNTVAGLFFCMALSLSPAARSADDVLILSSGKTISVPGFRMYVASGYVPSEKNIELLKGLKEKVATTRLIAFDTTKNNKNMLLCRVSYPVYGPNKTPFAALIEAAANMEMAAAGLAAPDSSKIQASLDEFDFSSFGSGKWSIDASFVAEGRPPVVIKSVYAYPVSAGAASGCGDVMKAMPAGIEAFLFKLYSDPAFEALLR